MTVVRPDGSGYFQDPYPARLAPSVTGRGSLVFSGTTQAIMSCAAPVAARCFAWTGPVTLDTTALQGAIAAAGTRLTTFQNLNAFQDDSGRWHAVVALDLQRSPTTAAWTVLVHAHATVEAAPDSAPLAWAADTVLSGSFSAPVDGNYDGKYFEDNGRLFLLYVKNLVPKPALRNGIVLQPMLSPTQPAPSAPTVLLTPGDRFGPLVSEEYDGTPAKLVEAPYIIRLGGKYALIYSTGAYRTAGYKAGVAWSDNLMPPAGLRYRKVLQTDAHGVWGQPGAAEVHYLLQSQQPQWPNFTAEQVIGPGVASALELGAGRWTLFFAGFAPDDRPPVGGGAAEADHRRPFFVHLRIAVPPGRSAAAASDAELAGWIELETR